MTVLISAGAETARGGVLGHCSTIRQYLGDDVVWFVSGNRYWGTPDSESLIQRARRLFLDYLRYAAVLRSMRPSVVHLNPSFKPLAFARDALFLALARRAGARVLVFFHGWDAVFASRPVVRWIFHHSYQYADACAVLSRDFGAQLRRLGFERSVYNESLAVEDEVFEQAPAAAAERDAVEAPFNILFLGRVEKTKGVFEALEAYAQLVTRWPRASLTIAGDGAALPEVRAQVAARALSGVRIRGFLQGAEKRQALQEAACYLLPSYTEGLPMTVLEAMAYGLPVVTRPVGGLVDFFEDGKMGYFVEGLSPADFAARMESILVNPALGRQMSSRNREFARAHFMASRVAQRLLDIYDTLGRRYAGGRHAHCDEHTAWSVRGV